ncbi:MAG: hypothetical protein KY444_02655 [Gemmatimonadetes bacterium]|nr:hypothetical protein [Gemmatimonadota bacterium]
MVLVALGVLGAVRGEDDEGGDAGTAAVETRTFSNSPEGLGGDLAKNYVPFSFNYPATWEVLDDGRAPDASNFVHVVRKEDDAIAESFNVGWITADPAAVQDPTMLSPIMDLQREQLAADAPDFRPIKTGPVTVGGRPGLELTFSDKVRDAPPGQEDLWGRVILLPGDDGRGLILLLVASPLAESVEGPAHVGVRGELPIILNSFKTGQR